jgi:hypothetical protein
VNVIVAGSRDFDDRELLFSVLDESFHRCLDRVTVVSGHARGADKLGEAWANSRGVKLEVKPADWDTHGKRAGPIRNAEMAEIGTHLVLFWDGASSGSRDMLDRAIKKGLWVKVVFYKKR